MTSRRASTQKLSGGNLAANAAAALAAAAIDLAVRAGGQRCMVYLLLTTMDSPFFTLSPGPLSQLTILPAGGESGGRGSGRSAPWVLGHMPRTHIAAMECVSAKQAQAGVRQAPKRLSECQRPPRSAPAATCPQSSCLTAQA